MSHDFLDNVKKNQARIAANIHGSYNIPTTQINKSEEGDETTKEEEKSSEENKQGENLEKGKEDELQKGGKKGMLGEEREWGGKKYRKTPNGWIPVAKKRVRSDDKVEGSGKKETTKTRSSEDDQRINLIEKLIKQGFSPEEAREKVEGKKEEILQKRLRRIDGDPLGFKGSGEQVVIRKLKDSENYEDFKQKLLDSFLGKQKAGNEGRYKIGEKDISNYAKKIWGEKRESKEVPTRKDKFDVRVGDTVGNTVHGFNFELLGISSGTHPLEVKDKKSGKVFNTTRENMYLSSSDFKKQHKDDPDAPSGEDIADIISEDYSDNRLAKMSPKKKEKLINDYIEDYADEASNSQKESIKDYLIDYLNQEEPGTDAHQKYLKHFGKDKSSKTTDDHVNNSGKKLKLETSIRDAENKARELKGKGNRMGAEVYENLAKQKRAELSKLEKENSSYEDSDFKKAQTVDIFDFNKRNHPLSQNLINIYKS